MKSKVVICLIVLFLSLRVTCQQDLPHFELSPNGLFDKVYDRFGNSYDLANLNTAAGKSLGGGSTDALISATCSAGYFTMHFEAGSFFDGNLPAQTVLCQVYSDVSNLINSSIPLGSINIHCGNTTNGFSAGAASQFFVFPANPINPNPGVIDGQVHKALITGTNPYQNIPLTFYNAGAYYHGFVQVSSIAPWSYSLNTTSIPSTEYDLYSVMLHEAFHSLGFMSLISSSGTSVFGAANNYYTRYDTYLHDNAGIPLLTSSSTSNCPATTNLSFAAASNSVIMPSICTNTSYAVDISTCSLAAQYISPTTSVTVYTPNCFEGGSSLSHFEDMCSWGTFTTACVPTPTSPGYNNLKFLMANFISPGSCYVKRHPVEEERNVLCDLGYSVNAAFGSSLVAGSSYSYNAGACSPTMNIYGLNDGITNSTYQFVTTTSSLAINNSSLLANDSPSNSLSVSCLDVVWGTAIVNQGSTDFTVTASIGAGLVVLRYYPENNVNQFGNATYVFVYFAPVGCNLPTACNLVQNGGFEGSQGSVACGIVGNNNLSVGCWDYYTSTYMLFSTNSCTPGPGYFQLGVNTYSTSPPVSTLNLGATTNNNCAGLFMDQQIGGGTSIIKNNLNAPMVPNQAYQLSMWVMNHGSTLGNASMNPNNYPTVLSIASNSVFAFTPTLNFPAGLNTLGQFTINAGNTWTQLTYTFVYTSSATVNANALLIGINSVNTASLGSYASSPPNKRIVFIDEVSLVALSGNTFAIPPSTVLCGPKTYTNLAQYASAISGTFSGVGVTNSGGQFNFNNPPSLPAGIYQIAFTYSANGCTHTIYDQVAIESCCTSTSIPSFPGCITYDDDGNCSSFYPVNTTTMWANYSNPGAPVKISSSFTIQPGVTLTFYTGEYIIAQGVSITVSSGAHLQLFGCHLRTCGNYLWKGIVVLDGGKLSMVPYGGQDNLIEDAETAVSVLNYISNTVSPILDINGAVFNKNYISINIANFKSYVNSAFDIKNTVFTSRDFTYTNNSWPQTSTLTTGLRAYTTPTPDLGSPYLLQGFPIVNLKNPFNNSRAHVAIQVDNAGVTAGTTYPTGYTSFSLTPGSPSEFLLFDAHEFFVTCNNSNVKINNCVFQNTQTFTLNSTYTVGAAITHSTPIVFNQKLDLSAPSESLGNRFYDCHRGIFSDNVFDFRLDHALFSSTQSTAALTSSTFQSTGQQAVFISTKQADKYYINNNRFLNIQSGVTINFYSGSVNANMDIAFGSWTVWPQTTYIYSVSVNNNTFSPEANLSYSGLTDHYVRNGVVITGPAMHYIYTAPCGCNRISVDNNLMYRVFNGVRMDGINSYTMSCKNSGVKKSISQNTITLEEDFNANPQKAISFTNSQSYPIQPSQGQAVQTIEKNILKVKSGNSALSNQNITLVFLENNGSISGSGVIYPTPHVLCNDLQYAYNGFVFSNFNQPVSWKGNKMQDLGRGMTLTNSGIIGQQGNSSNPIDNAWNGSWSGSSGTYVENGSVAQMSALYTRSTSPWATPNNSGLGNPLLWYGATGGTISAVGSYNCANQNYSLVAATLPNAPKYESAELLYIANTFAYRFLAVNDSLREHDTLASIFYTNLAGTSIDKFNKVELAINAGEYEDATGLLTAIDQSGFIAPETNYYNFYILYSKFKQGEEEFTTEDLISLQSIADLCPSENGQAVYQARALFQVSSGLVYNEGNSCATGERHNSNILEPDLKKIENASDWELALYPNPMVNVLTILSNQECEKLNIIITDLSNRVVYATELKTIDFGATFNLNLNDGVYIIKFYKGKNECITKKLLISK